MDYINPTSIAGMYNVPKDNSLPGSGYGLTQGFLEGQAANRANDFLNMSQINWAQDTVNKQFQNQKQHEMYPLELEAKRLGNEHTRSQISASDAQRKYQEEQYEKLRGEGKLQKFAHAASFYDAFANAKTDMERIGLLDTYNTQMGQLHDGFPKVSLRGKTPEERAQHWNEIVQDLRQARDITALTGQVREKQAVQASQGAIDENLQGKKLRSAEKMNADDNAAKLEAARIAASKASRGPNSTEYNMELDNMAFQLLTKKAKNNGQLPPEEEAQLQYLQNIRNASVQGAMTRTDPGRVGAAEEAKQGAPFKVFDRIKVERYALERGLDVDFDNYDYAIGKDGELLRKKKTK